jgi:hypothetical protein
MKKTTKTKMGPLGTPLGNPLGYFNSQKAKRSAEPKQKLRKAQNGDSVTPYIGGTKSNPSDVAPTLKQAGVKNIYQGPLNKRDVDYMDSMYPSTAFAPTPSAKGYPYDDRVRVAPPATNAPKDRQYVGPEAVEQYNRNRRENILRSNDPYIQQYNKNPNMTGEDVPIRYDAEDYKKGGSIKKKSVMKKGGTVKKTTTIKRKK